MLSKMDIEQNTEGKINIKKSKKKKRSSTSNETEIQKLKPQISDSPIKKSKKKQNELQETMKNDKNIETGKRKANTSENEEITTKTNDSSIKKSKKKQNELQETMKNDKNIETGKRKANTSENEEITTKTNDSSIKKTKKKQNRKTNEHQETIETSDNQINSENELTDNDGENNEETDNDGENNEETDNDEDENDGENNEEETEETNEQPKKKLRAFHVKEFRQQLFNKNSAYEAIKNFIQLCSDETATQDYALEYLENGGHTSELIRIIDTSENKNASFILPIIEAFTIVVLKIISSHPQKQLNAEESCREILNKHFSIIKSMLSLSSNAKQRKVALKLLSTMVTLSPSIAKEVLAHTIFDQAVLEVLTQPSHVLDGSSVRTSFIHFLISFLIEGHVPTIITLLEKRGLLTSVFSGLIYDTPDIIEILLSTIQNKILEETLISKTIKMNTFNTQVVQNIVNLYNWKGPKHYKPNNKRKPTRILVNQAKKERVSKIAHKFLLVLCASKHGIIFYDPTIGLSNKKYNPLILSVLQSLDKPWNNKFASELVIKICVACPDLVKVVLSSVETFLEPRVSQNWLTVVEFIKTLINNLEPKCVEQFLGQLNIKQISIIIQTFCVPYSILKSISFGLNHDHIGIRHESAKLLLVMLNSLNKYMNIVNNLQVLTVENKITLKGLMHYYLNKNLPIVADILKDWYKSIGTVSDIVEPGIVIPELNVHLTTLLDILYNYHQVCPQLVDHITKEIDTNNFFKTIEDLCKDQNKNAIEMHIKAINLLFSCDNSLFLPSKHLFSNTLTLLLQFYYHTTGELQSNIELILIKLLKISGIFESCPEETTIWLYSFLQQNTFNKEIAELFTSAVVKTTEKFLKYVDKMASLRESSAQDLNFKLSDYIESLLLDSNSESKFTQQNRHKMLSPLILGFFDLLVKAKINSEEYLNILLLNLLHLQTSPNLIISLALQDKYNKIIDKHILKYYKSWNDNTIISFKKIYNPENVFYKLNKFLSIDDETDFETIFSSNVEWKHFYNILITNMTIFYYTQKAVKNTITKPFDTKCYQILIHIFNNSNNPDCLNSVLKHPILLQLFMSNSNSFTTDFVINLIEELLKTKPISELETYLDVYRIKLVKQIIITLKKLNKNTETLNADKLMYIIKLIEFDYDQSADILKIISDLPAKTWISDDKPTVVIKILSYILNHKNNLQTLKPFSNEIIQKIRQNLYEINVLKPDINLEELEISLCTYITQFPHVNCNFDALYFDSLISKTVMLKSTVKLATILLKNNIKLLETFENKLEHIWDKRELVLSLMNSVKDLNLPSIKELLSKVYEKYDEVISKFINKPQKAANYFADNYQIIIKLITNEMKLENCKEFVLKSHKFDITEIHHAKVVSSIFMRGIFSEDTEIKVKYISNYNTTMMQLLNTLLKRAEKTTEDWNKIEKISKLFSINLIKIKNAYKIEYTDEGIYKLALFQTFSKLCLKFGLQEKALLIDLLKQLCSLADKQNGDLGILFEMAISHSEALNILLSEDERKTSLLNFLLTICKKSPNVMVKSHIPIWLSAYEATLSPSDQYILELLSLYESANIGFHEFRPYLWGKAAVGHYSVRSGIENTLWRQPKPKEVLELFNENKIIKTIKNFPRSRKLVHNQTLYSDSDIDVYDPSFYLPLLSHLLAPESTIRWYQVTQRGIISLAIIALTSECEKIRSAACFVLARFHHHLEAATYAKQRFLWLRLIEAICRGTSTLENLKPCAIVAIFLSGCAFVFTRPDQPLYSSLGNYIMARECPNFTVVPELLSMLHSTDVNHSVHRNFILEVIRDGLCTDDDLKVLYRSVAFKLILDLYNSVLIDSEAKKLILEIISAAVNIKNGAKVLVTGYSLISWLHGISKQFNSTDKDLLIAFINLINNLVSSYEEDTFKYLQSNILLLLVSFIDTLIGSRLDLNNLLIFIKVLYKVYEQKPDVLSKLNLENLLTCCSKLIDCQICNYYLQYGAEFVENPTLASDDIGNQSLYYLKLLTIKWIKANK